MFPKSCFTDSQRVMLLTIVVLRVLDTNKVGIK